MMILAIIAIMLVAAIILIFLLVMSSRRTQIPPGPNFNMQTFIESCIRQSVTNTADKMIAQGGFVEPKNALYFDKMPVEYLCENIGFYEPCIQQHPMLLSEMKEDLRKTVEPIISGCFVTAKQELQRREIKMTSDPAKQSVQIDFSPDKIFVKVKREVTLEGQGGAQNFEDFKTEINSPLYNFATIAMEISSQEARFCNFEYAGYSVFYPQYTIEKFQTSSLSKVYRIKSSQSSKGMNIAIRSCAIPAGF